jgi:hypothetical protein
VRRQTQVITAEEIAERLAYVRRQERILGEFVVSHDEHYVRIDSFAERAFCPACGLLWSVVGDESTIEPVFELVE